MNILDYNEKIAYINIFKSRLLDIQYNNAHWTISYKSIINSIFSDFIGNVAIDSEILVRSVSIKAVNSIYTQSQLDS